MSLLEKLRPSAAQQDNRADFVAFLGDDDSVEIMKRYVSQRLLPHAHVVRGNVDSAIQFLQAQEQPPVQLLIDISTSETPLSELARLADTCEPSIEVYVIGSRNDVGLYRSLLQLGVRDYLVKPLTVDLLTRILEKNGPSPNQTRTGKVISLIGSRGGVGVSTITTHLGHYLAHAVQRRVALVDLHLHGGTLNIQLGLESNNGLLDVLQNVHRLDTQYMERTLVNHSSRLSVLSASIELDRALTIRPGAVGDLIDVLKQHFHYVLVDTPPAGTGNGHLTLEALNHSKVVYVVADHSIHTARHVPELLNYAGLRESEPAVSLLLNQPAPLTPAHVSPADLAIACKREALLSLPYDALAVVMAENLGEPLPVKSPFAQAVARLGNDLSGTGGDTLATATTGSWLTRWQRLIPRKG